MALESLNSPAGLGMRSVIVDRSFHFLVSHLSQNTGLEAIFQIALLECQTLLQVYFLSEWGP